MSHMSMSASQHANGSVLPLFGGHANRGLGAGGGKASQLKGKMIGFEAQHWEQFEGLGDA